MTKFDIHSFDKYRENNRLEVKKASGGLPNSLWDTYSSFANSYGGVILLGVIENDDGSFKTTGLKDFNKLKKDFWNTINNSSKTSINLLTDDDIESYEVNGDVILAIYIPKASRQDKPVFINGDMFKGTFRRNNEGDYRCAKNEVLAMLRDQTEDTPDMKVLDDMEISDLDSETVRSYRNRHSSYHPEHVWDNLSDDNYLEMIGAARISNKDKRLHPTAAGLLMFGKEYKILYEFPEYFLDYREILDPTIRWTDRSQSSSGDWSGNLFDFFFRVSPKLSRDLKVPFKLEGITRIDDTPVHKALREALANCIVNTDFFVSRGIVIRKDDEKIVIENPGYIRTGKDQMLKGGISDPRNKALMKMFNMIGIGERAGSGVPDIFSVWESNGWITPEIEELYNPDRTILTLSFKKKEAYVSGETLVFSGENVTVEDETLVFTDEKITIQQLNDRFAKTKFSSPTTEKILQIYKAFANNQIFGAKEIRDIFAYSDSGARQLIKKMENARIIAPVKGHGKGKYRFKYKNEK